MLQYSTSGAASSDAPPHLDVSVRPVALACRAAVDGRSAVKALADWARRFELSEPDFQTLWCLRLAMQDRIDQATLAGRLALSPAQLSNTVDRLGTHGWITCNVAPDDRRRHLWQLTSNGHELLERMLAEVGQLRYDSRAIASPSTAALFGQKEAA